MAELSFDEFVAQVKEAIRSMPEVQGHHNHIRRTVALNRINEIAQMHKPKQTTADRGAV